MKYLLIEHGFEKDNSIHTESELIALAEQYSIDTHYTYDEREVIDTIHKAISFFEGRAFTVLPLDNSTNEG